MADTNTEKNDKTDYGAEEVNIDEVMNNQDTATAICEAVTYLITSYAVHSIDFRC